MEPVDPGDIKSAVLADPVVKAVLAETGETGGVGAPSGSTRDTVTTQSGNVVATPTTTEEQDRGTQGQRDVNMVWENTQRQVALAVIAVALAVAAWLAVAGASDNSVAASVFLYGVANLVIGFYFGRTNHQRVGGIMQGR